MRGNKAKVRNIAHAKLVVHYDRGYAAACLTPSEIRALMEAGHELVHPLEPWKEFGKEINNPSWTYFRINRGYRYNKEARGDV